MKRLRFDELALVSQVERAGLRLKFNRTSTVIKGANDTGKSSVVKSLYSTLGAEPQDVHPAWKSLRVMSSLKFFIDDAAYRMIQNGSRYILYDSDDNVVNTYTRVTKELAPAIADLFDFRLHLKQNNNASDSQATPAFLFMPFYIDQDAGWETDWMGSFAGRKQFRYTRPDILKFHFGIRPSEWYMANLRQVNAASKAAEVRHEYAVLERVLQSILEELKTVDFSINLDVFKEEVDRLLEQCNRLKQHEEKMRSDMVQAYNHLTSIREQIAIASHVLSELRADREYSAQLEGDTVRCPTCHAEYDNGFAQRFGLALDEDGCISQLGELDEQRRKAENAYQDAARTTESARGRVIEVEQILNERHEELKLQDLLRSEGRREMLEVVRRQLSALSERLGQHELDITRAMNRKKEFENKKRSSEIHEYYRSHITRLFHRLDVKGIPEKSYKRLGTRIQETGSDVPRAVLGLFLAGLKTAEKYSTSTICPAVIDSPNQQDQDAESWRLICETIREERPSNIQLILAGADDGNTDFGGDVISFSQKRQVLDKDQYETLWEELGPLYEMGIQHEVDD